MTCLVDAIAEIGLQIENGNVNEQALATAGTNFIEHFDNPEPITEELGKTIFGFGEAIVLYTYIGIFIVAMLIVWFLVSRRLIHWKTALFLTIVIILVLISLALLFGISMRDYLTNNFDSLILSYQTWTESQITRVPVATYDASCVFVEESKNL